MEQHGQEHFNHFVKSVRQNHAFWCKDLQIQVHQLPIINSSQRNFQIPGLPQHFHHRQAESSSHRVHTGPFLIIAHLHLKHTPRWINFFFGPGIIWPCRLCMQLLGPLKLTSRRPVLCLRHQSCLGVANIYLQNRELPPWIRKDEGLVQRSGKHPGSKCPCEWRHLSTNCEKELRLWKR